MFPSSVDVDALRTARASAEAQRAKVLNAQLGPKAQPRTDVIVDLHTTTSNMGVSIIVGQGDVLTTTMAAYVVMKLKQNSKAFYLAHFRFVHDCY